MTEFLLTILLTPIFMFIGLSILGFILGLIADPYYGLPNDKPRKEMLKRRKRK